MRIVLVAGARPNFMKVAPIIDAIKKSQTSGSDISYSLVHTGQHYDQKMSDDFFVELGIPLPDINLGAGGGTQAEQTAAIMVGFEKYLMSNPCDLVLVVGDVTSTLACSIVTKKMKISVGHVEGGIRSGDWTMPEEVNRVVTDSISDYFFTTSHTANQNLLHEGKHEDQIFFVGNTMIDTLLKHQHRFREPEIFRKLALKEKEYLVMTLHRPANVDSEENLQHILEAIENESGNWPIVFPVHPRTQRILEKFEVNFEKVQLMDPLSYLEFNFLVQKAGGVITDSGGITEETTVMGIPCITLRNSTERPETVSIGTNELIGSDPSAIGHYLRKILNGTWKKGSIPEKWDGCASTRIVYFIETLKLGLRK